MQRAVPALFLALVAAAAGYLLAFAQRPAAPPADAAATALATVVSEATKQGVDTSAAAARKEPDAGVKQPPMTELEKMLNGGDVPKLPNNAPSKVSIAVILFSHAEAQFAGKKARKKSEALRLAKELLPEARENFAEAVKRGDPGSTADAGTVPRGVLEPALQYVVYTLEKGQVFPEPLDTPRGYWVVKRTR